MCISPPDGREHGPQDRVIIYQQVSTVVRGDRLGDHFLNVLGHEADVFLRIANPERILFLVTVANRIEPQDFSQSRREPPLDGLEPDVGKC